MDYDGIYTSFIELVANGNLPMIERYLDIIESPPRRSMFVNHGFSHAISCGHTEIVKFLLKDSQVVPHRYENEAIRIASRCGHTDIVKILLADSRVDPGDCGNAAIRSASEHGRVGTIRLLLADPRVDPTACKHAIKAASKNKHKLIVELLLMKTMHFITIHDYIQIRSCVNKEIDELWISYMLNYNLIMSAFMEQHLVIDLLESMRGLIAA